MTGERRTTQFYKNSGLNIGLTYYFRQRNYMEITYKDYLYPTRASLKKGCIHDIYLNLDDGEVLYEGKARLVEPCHTWRLPLPYVKYENREDESNNSITVNWMFERWTVIFISGRMKGHVTCRNIHYFYSLGDQLSNIYEEEE